MSSNLVTNLQAKPYPIESITKMGQFEPFELQVSRGQIMGHIPVYIFGNSAALGSTAYGPLWEGLTASGGSYVYPSVAARMYIFSSSASDTAVQVTINGLDANYNILTEVITTNGTTSVQTVNSYFRINSMFVNSAPVGNISLYSNSAQTGGTLYAKVLAGNLASQASIYTVPAGYTFYKYNLQADANTSVVSSGYNRVRTFASPPVPPAVAYQSVFVQQFNQPISFPISFPEKTDIQWQVLANTGTNTVANLYIGGLLVQNDGQALASAL
jgi:hypothetical protein